MSDFLVENRSATKTVRLSGDLVVQHAARLAAVLRESLAGADCLGVEIDATAVTDADVSFLQLLCAAHKTAIRQDKTLAFGPCPDTVRRLARNAGFGRHTGCLLDAPRSCLLKGLSHD